MKTSTRISVSFEVLCLRVFVADLFVFLFVVFFTGCQEKESVTVKEKPGGVQFERHIKKQIDFTKGEADTFNPKSSCESSRKTVLTNFGRLPVNPPVQTVTQEDLEIALDYQNAQKLFVMTFVNRPIYIPGFPFDYENDIGRLKKLYSSHDLGSVVKPDMSELEKITALMVYTNRFLGGGRVLTTEERNTISGPSAEVITRLRREKGIGGTSEEYAALFCQLTLACGFNSRILSMHTIDKDGAFLTNDVCEVYLNIYDKWAVFDPYNRATYYMRNGVPLSALEVRELMLENRYREIFPQSHLCDFADIPSLREKLLPRYQYLYMWRMNDILSKGKNGSVLPWQALYKYHLIWEDGYAPVADGKFDRLDKFTDTSRPDYKLTGVHYITHEKKDFYWSLNHAVMHIKRTGINELTIYFDTMTPNFDHFYFLVDNVKFEVKNKIELRELVDDFVLRSVNKFGVYGPYSNINTAM